MEQHYKNFITTLYNFMNDLNRYSHNDNIHKLIQVYNQLDMAKVIFKVANFTKEFANDINNKNQSIFDKPLFILPEIDLSLQWSKLTTAQKNKSWTYLHILSIESDFLMNFDKQSSEVQSVHVSQPTEQITQTETSQEPKHLDFNPYVGVGTNDGNYGVNELYSATPNLKDDKPTAPGISSVLSMLGVDKMINMDELSQQLKNMKKEDIDNATNNIRSLLGNNIDENTSALINDMLTGITTELNNKNVGNGDPLQNIMKIAESVATKIQPRMENQNFDMSKLLNSTQTLADQCKDDSGKPLFSGNTNPFAMLNQLTGLMKNNQEMSEDQYIQNCNNMLKNMGFEGVDVENMDLGNITNQLKNKMSKKIPKSKKK